MAQALDGSTQSSFPAGTRSAPETALEPCELRIPSGGRRGPTLPAHVPTDCTSQPADALAPETLHPGGINIYPRGRRV
ncbi:hypothetical protein Sros01_10380 [Streptomyces roseochromogenus]|nr:hypothetical protein Sros01_10380 [Streptomyces roseochromogenus]